jgi:glyoxylase-like metal-dependent hydrolase (beta-lactamase superfamily II)
MLSWTVGDVQITQVVESEAALPVDVLFPSSDPAKAAALDWVAPFLDGSGFARLGINAYLVQTPSLRMVVDCCAGNGKPRAYPGFDHLDTDFLDRLVLLGFGPEAVDVVVCTHLHSDHVGWNTVARDGRWVPTFPNARYLIGRIEFEHWRTQTDSPDDRSAFDDSVGPVFDAGQVDLVDPGHRIADGVWLISTPGHTPGHHSVRISSGGAEAIITGDMVHHPAQIAWPEWSAFNDSDPAGSAVVRREVFAETASGGHLLIGTHFVAPSAGRLVAEGGAWRLVP